MFSSEDASSESRNLLAREEFGRRQRRTSCRLGKCTGNGPLDFRARLNASRSTLLEKYARASIWAWISREFSRLGENFRPKTLSRYKLMAFRAFLLSCISGEISAGNELSTFYLVATWLKLNSTFLRLLALSPPPFASLSLSFSLSSSLISHSFRLHAPTLIYGVTLPRFFPG